MFIFILCLVAKSTEENPKLPGTIFSAAKECEAVGGRALAISCDIRFEDQIKKAVDQTVQK